MSLTKTAVAASVRAELARAGISGRRLARELGWSPGLVQRRLAGTEPFRVDELGQIADHLGIPVSRFVEQPAEAAS